MSVREEARRLLRHYPGVVEVAEAGIGAPSLFDQEEAWSLLSRTGTNITKTDESATGCSDQAGKCPARECLTDAEREAVEVAAEAYADDHGERFAATLRSLLERTKCTT